MHSMRLITASPPESPIVVRVPESRLPDNARDRLARLRDRVSDARALYDAASDDWQEAYKAIAAPTADVRRLRDARTKDDDPQMIAAQARLAAAQDKSAKLIARRDERSARWSTAKAVLDGVERWLAALPDDLVIEAHPLPAVKLAKHETHGEAIERLRQQRADLLADAHAVRSAPITSREAHALVAAQVEELAERGRPGVYGVLDHGGEIVWPMIQTESQVIAVAAIDAERRAVDGRAIGTVVDGPALLVWLHKAAILKALAAEIDKAANDAGALSPEDRAMRLSDIQVAILEVERLEVATIDAAPGEVGYRADTDPRAVLGVTGPARAA